MKNMMKKQSLALMLTCITSIFTIQGMDLTPLYYAAKAENTEKIKLLLKDGANPHAIAYWNDDSIDWPNLLTGMQPNGSAPDCFKTFKSYSSTVPNFVLELFVNYCDLADSAQSLTLKGFLEPRLPDGYSFKCVLMKTKSLNMATINGMKVAKRDEIDENTKTILNKISEITNPFELFEQLHEYLPGNVIVEVEKKLKSIDKLLNE